MKKNILLLLLCSISTGVFSQEQETASLNTLKRIEMAKSGNLIDAFGGFYQLAFKSITVNEKSLDLNSTLFSLVKNYDASVLTTKSRNSVVFLRNFQVNAKINLNDKFNFNGYSAGFTYAVLNERDKGFIDIDNTVYATHVNQLNLLINAAIMAVTATEMANFAATQGRVMNPTEMNKLGNELTEVNNAIQNGRTIPALQRLYDASVLALDAQISASPYFIALQGATGVALGTSAEINTYLDGLKNDFLSDLEKKPFLSLSSDGITDQDGKLNQASAGVVFLVGNRFGELDARAKYNYADTLAISMPRAVFNGKIGYNFKLINRAEKSFFEIKAYGEYNKVLKNALPDEDEETILLNADFRIRFTDDLWIPLTVKYDTEKANFLGFLNVTYSFGG